MRFLIFFLLVFLPWLLKAQRDDFRSDSIRIQKIALHVIPDMTKKTIQGSAQITFQPSVDLLSSMRFDLLQMSISSLQCSPTNATYYYDSRTIFIQFLTPLRKDSTYTLSIEYQGTPMQDASAWGGWYWSGNYAFNLGVGFQSIPHNLGRAWFPCVDNFKMKQSFEITISCPQQLKAVSNGLLVSQIDSGGFSTYKYTMSQPIPCYLASCNIGPYFFLNDTLKSVDGRILNIRIALDMADTAKARLSFGKLKKTVSYFESLFGPYPFDVVGYSLVPFSNGAMEHAANIALPIAMIDGSLNYETTWAHELSHMWWGDNITCAAAEEMWINEGWASYCERLFLEYFYGVEAYTKSIADNHRYCLQFAHVIDNGYYPLDSVPQKYTYGTHSYQKGCDMIHTLRNLQESDSVFALNCKLLHQQHKFGVVNTDTVISYFAPTTCVRNGLEMLFHQPYYLSNKLESTAIKSSNIIDVKLATYPLRDVSNTCFPIQFLSLNTSSVSGSNYSMVHANGIYQVTGNSNSMVIFDEQNKFSDANTSHKSALNAVGALNFDNEICNVILTQKSDSGYLYINRSWDYTGGEFIVPGIQANSKGFWTVEGDMLDRIVGTIRFYYNGSIPVTHTGFEGVDLGFITKSEDSLVLLYREKYNDPWRINYDALKIVGSLTDKKGSFLLNKITRGQYCIGQYNSKSMGVAISSELRNVEVYPNPTHASVFVRLLEETLPASIEIIDGIGHSVYVQQVALEKNAINLDGFTKGIYFIRIVNETQLLYKKLIID